MKKVFVLLLVSFALTGCIGNGPEKPLREMGKALEQKNGALFLAQIDTKAFAAAEINTLTQGDPALRTLDSVGKMLGLGGMNQLLGSVLEMQTRQEDLFSRGVSTGELMLQCSKATSPDCPWVPSALSNAKIKKINETSAVAQVTTPTNITSWIALRKIGEKWLVVGWAPVESLAMEYAAGSKNTTPPKQQENTQPEKAPTQPPKAPAQPPKEPAQPKKERPKEPVNI